MTEPLEPPRESVLPGAGGEVGPEPEDFQVDEIPAYEPAGEGDHVYVRIRKRLMTTQAAIRLLARAAGVAPRDVGSAGQKDRLAVTTQWLSLPPGATDPGTWQLPDDLRVEEVSRHRNKLRTGHLHGNRFRIRLLGADPDAARAVLDELRPRGVLNYFGPQRFGHGGRNLDRALALLDPESRLRVDRFERKMLPSVVQSELFNRYTVLRSGRSEEVALRGEWVRLQGAGQHFCVDDVADASRRLRERDLVLTGPLPGGRIGASTDEAAELEQEAASGLAWTDAQREALSALAPGTRRDLRVPIDDATVDVDPDGATRLTFRLPAGSYASMVVRELTGRPWSRALRDGMRDGD